jgi:cell division septum initiation protein DivIVA
VTEEQIEALAAEVSDLEKTIKELQEQLDYYQTRGQRILDLTAEKCMAILERDEPPTAAELNVIRQLLKDQGIIDLRNGATPTNHLKKRYPFAAPEEDGKPFGVQNHG